MPPTSPTSRLVRRYDRAEGQLLRVYRREQDGALLAEGYACSERIQVYRNADGSERRELVTLQAVKDTAAGIGRAVLTFHHPKQWVDPDTYQDATVGDVDGVTELTEPVAEDVQGGFCQVKVAIRRRDAIEAFEDEGVVELSPGYIAEVIDEPGEWNGQRYDAKQVRRTAINHLALVPRGRGGRSIRLRADTGDAELVPSLSPRGDRSAQTPTPRTAMNNLFALAGLLALDVRADAEDAQLVTEIFPAVKQLKADADEGEAFMKAVKDMGYEDLAALKADMGALKGIMKDMGCEDMAGLKKAVMDMKVKKDAAEADLATLRADHDALKTRIDGIEAAEASARLKRLADHLNAQRADADQVKLDGLDLKAQRVAVAKARLDAVTADSPDAYVDCVLDLVEGEIKSDAAGSHRASHLDDLNGFEAPAGTAATKRRVDADPFYDPHRDHAAQAFKAAAGGDL